MRGISFGLFGSNCNLFQVYWPNKNLLFHILSRNSTYMYSVHFICVGFLLQSALRVGSLVIACIYATSSIVFLNYFRLVNSVPEYFDLNICLTGIF